MLLVGVGSGLPVICRSRPLVNDIYMHMTTYWMKQNKNIIYWRRIPWSYMYVTERCSIKYIIEYWWHLINLDTLSVIGVVPPSRIMSGLMSSLDRWIMHTLVSISVWRICCSEMFLTTAPPASHHALVCGSVGRCREWKMTKQCWSGQSYTTCTVVIHHWSLVTFHHCSTGQPRNPCLYPSNQSSLVVGAS